MVITFGLLLAFFAVIVVVLHVAERRQDVATFSNYAVGERSFSSWFVSMAHTNSWWPGSTFTGAQVGLLTGIAIAIALSVPYIELGGAVPWLGGFGSGLVGLLINLVVYVGVSCARPSDRTELDRVDQLFAQTRSRSIAHLPAGSAARTGGATTGPVANPI